MKTIAILVALIAAGCGMPAGPATGDGGEPDSGVDPVIAFCETCDLSAATGWTCSSPDLAHDTECLQKCWPGGDPAHCIPMPGY